VYGCRSIGHTDRSKLHFGGAGGNGYAGAAGGSGAASNLTNAVTGATTGGFLQLYQTAAGGGGGAGSGVGGAGGAASSSLTFDDTTNTTRAATFNGYSKAQGGVGASGTSGGAGGDATSYLSITGAHLVSGRAIAAGGGGGSGGGAGGGASATAIVSAAGLATDASATATALATAGNPGAAAQLAGAQRAGLPVVLAAQDGVETRVLAQATAQTAGGQPATASATATGADATATSVAFSAGAGVVRSLEVSATSSGAGTDTSSATAGVQGTQAGFGAGTLAAYSTAEGAPTASVLGALEGNSPNVSAVLGATSGSVAIADGTLGANEPASATGSLTYTNSQTLTVDAAELTGNLLLGFVTPQAVGAGATAATLTVTVGTGGPQIFNETNAGAVASFFNNDVVDLGAFTAAANLPVTVTLAETISGPDAGFGVNYVLGAAGGHGPPVISAPLTAALTAGSGRGLAGVGLAEAGDTKNQSFTMTLSDAHGLLSATAAGAAQVSGADSTALTIQGSVTDVADTLLSLVLTVPPFLSDTITLTATDNLGAAAVGRSIDVSVSCFAEGTRIETSTGMVAVENLREGDLVLTGDGAREPIVWIGRRAVNCQQHPKPKTVWPVCVRAGAFGPARPHADLFLSPDHAVFVNDVLIPIKHLINGSTITQVPVDHVSYYHIELPRHDVILAEGLPAESFLDMKDGSNYANRPGPVRLCPDYTARMWEAFGCAPLIVTGPELVAARAVVTRFAQSQARRGSGPDVGAAGRREDKQRCAGGRFNRQQPGFAPDRAIMHKDRVLLRPAAMRASDLGGHGGHLACGQAGHRLGAILRGRRQTGDRRHAAVSQDAGYGDDRAIAQPRNQPVA